MSSVPRPFLKWAGGKAQLLSQFAPLYPGRVEKRRYIEPFLGSGAVFFQVWKLFRPSAVILADENEELINVYTAIRDDVEEVIKRLARHKASHSRDYYYRIRGRESRGLSRVARAARMIYLNKTCFNGLYRVNRQDRFNVPLGRYRKPPILDAENLRAVSRALQGADIRAAHFSETVAYARGGDFIYLDPPYHPRSRTSSFTSYTRASFRDSDQIELSEVYARLTRKGCLLMLSNSDTSFIRRLFRRHDIRKVQARRSINSRADRRGRISELVVLNYEPAGSTSHLPSSIGRSHGEGRLAVPPERVKDVRQDAGVSCGTGNRDRRGR